MNLLMQAMLVALCAVFILSCAKFVVWPWLKRRRSFSYRELRFSKSPSPRSKRQD